MKPFAVAAAMWKIKENKLVKKRSKFLVLRKDTIMWPEEGMNFSMLMRAMRYTACKTRAIEAAVH